MPRKIRLLVGVAWFLLAACGAGAREPAEEMHEVMAEFARLDTFSGTVLVARDGDIVFAEAFGDANKDHRVANTLESRFNIGSINKMFTAVAVLQLVEKDLVDLDTDE